MKKLRKFLLRVFVLILLVAGGGAYWLTSQWKAPFPEDKVRLVRFEDATPLTRALQRLEEGKIVKNAMAAKVYAKWKNVPNTIRVGTYELGGNLDLQGVFDALRKPVKRMVRLPEEAWAQETAEVIQKQNLGKASEYLALVKKPAEFQKYVDFPLPKDSLEGYLYPDTYDLPPLMTPKDVIRRQLANFERRVKKLQKIRDLHEVIIVASMVEMEVKRDEERNVVAAVIWNRLAKKMPLQIDAAINYGIQKWRPLTYDDYKNVDSPYNLYRNKGLPPGPICSPTYKSIQAAMYPSAKEYLYYVAMPDGQHLFAMNLNDHNRNVAKRRAALRAVKPK